MKRCQAEIPSLRDPAISMQLKLDVTNDKVNGLSNVVKGIISPNAANWKNGLVECEV